MTTVNTLTRKASRSRPLLSRSGCLYDKFESLDDSELRFSSPFIEERLYLMWIQRQCTTRIHVLVPFYRGAVVFIWFDRQHCAS